VGDAVGSVSFDPTGAFLAIGASGGAEGKLQVRYAKDWSLSVVRTL
jgi:hypothetical protein